MTTSERADLGFGDALAGLSDFKPKAKKAPVTKPEKATVTAAAEASGFKSREPSSTQPIKNQRRRRTGRTAQLNIKATPEAIEAFYSIADANGWGLGEALEHAVKLLQAKVKR